MSNEEKYTVNIRVTDTTVNVLAKRIGKVCIEGNAPSWVFDDILKIFLEERKNILERELGVLKEIELETSELVSKANIISTKIRYIEDKLVNEAKKED